jgi:hypothetical protein
MPRTKPHTERDDPRQQQAGAQQQGGSTGTPRQQQQQPPQQPPREPQDPRDVDPDVHEKDPEGDVETGGGGRSPQVPIDRE